MISLNCLLIFLQSHCSCNLTTLLKYKIQIEGQNNLLCFSECLFGFSLYDVDLKVISKQKGKFCYLDLNKMIKKRKTMLEKNLSIYYIFFLRL